MQHRPAVFQDVLVLLESLHGDGCPWTRDSIDPRLQASAVAAAAQCTNEGGQNSCNLYWAAGNEHGNSFGVGEQLATLEVIKSLLYPAVAGPVSRNSGGTSLSNPDAGLDNTTEFLPIQKPHPSLLTRPSQLIQKHLSINSQTVIPILLLVPKLVGIYEFQAVVP